MRKVSIFFGAITMILLFSCASRSANSTNTHIFYPGEENKLIELIEKTSIPYDTIVLSEGIFEFNLNQPLTCNLKGTSQKPVVIKSMSGKYSTTIKGSIQFSSVSNHVQLHEISITSPTCDRTTRRPPGINIYGSNITISNCVIYNHGHPGIGVWNAPLTGKTQIYGCYFFGNGNYDPGNLISGSAIYAQSKESQVLIKHNVSFHNFTTGMKAYAKNGYVNNFTFSENVLFENGDGKADDNAMNLFVGSATNSIQNLKIIGNMTYRARKSKPGYKFKSVVIGYPWDECNHQNAIISDNYFATGETYLPYTGAIGINHFEQLIFKNNTVVSPSKFWNLRTHKTDGVLMAQNNYISTRPYYGINHSNDLFTLRSQETHSKQPKTASSSPSTVNLKDIGLSNGDTYTISSTPNDTFFVLKNQYDQRQTVLVIYNWTRSKTFQFKPGDTNNRKSKFEVRDITCLFDCDSFTLMSSQQGQVTIDLIKLAKQDKACGIKNESFPSSIDTSNMPPEFVVLELVKIK